MGRNLAKVQDSTSAGSYLDRFTDSNNKSFGLDSNQNWLLNKSVTESEHYSSFGKKEKSQKPTLGQGSSASHKSQE